MPIEFIGMIGVKPEGADGAAVHVIGGEIDLAWIRDFSRAHEAADFDKVLVGYTSTAAEGFVIAGYAAAHTERLAYLIAHRPGFVAPTLAARKAATFDHVSGGRLALHIITGGSDADQAKDGDWLDHDTRYRRTDEYLTLLRRVWTEARPFDHEGEFYKVAKAYSEIKPFQPAGVPLYFGGASESAHRIGARHADVYMLWGEPLAAVKQRIAEVRDAALPFGREPRFSVSLRPIIAPTEARAWDKARDILAKVQAKQGDRTLPNPEAVGAQRLVDFAREGRHPRQAPVDPDRRRGGRLRQHRAGGHARAGRGVPPRLLRARRDHAPHPRLRSAARCRRVRARQLIPLVRAEVARRDRYCPR